MAMSLTMIIFWGLVIWAVVTVIRTLGSSETRRREAPEEILAGRLARGEIEEDEYRHRLDTLRHGSRRDSVRGKEP